MRSIRNILAALLSFIMCQGAVANQPPVRPDFIGLTCSINGRWCAKLDPQGGVHVFHRATKKKLTPAWSAPLKLQLSLSMALIVTSDGACVINVIRTPIEIKLSDPAATVTEHDAQFSNSVFTQINHEPKPSDPAFIIMCRDGARHLLPLGMFVDDVAGLANQPWPKRWDIPFFIDKYDRLNVGTMGRGFLINVHNGQVISTMPTPPADSPGYSSPPR